MRILHLEDDKPDRELVRRALVQKKCPEVPFLFVSGTIGEERAIESLKSGATDYVLKERLDRLLPAVREFAVAVLQSQGYRVLQAASGIDALEV